MIAAVLIWTAGLLAVGTPVATPASTPPSVRLAPVGCVDLPDASVRVPLRVELGARLLDDAAADPRDFVLLSIACDRSEATLLAVRQGAGTPVRRLVPLGDVAPEVRPRALALAAVELLQVADLRDAPPPTPAAAVDKEGAGTPVERGPTPTVGAAFLIGSFLGSGNYFTTGGALRVGLELGAQSPPDPSWGFGLAYELMALGGSSETVLTHEALALAQRRGGRFVSELGLGARLGSFTESTTSPTGITTSTSHRAGGPVGTVAAHGRLVRGLSSDLSMEVGYDFRGSGVWLTPQFGVTLRF